MNGTPIGERAVEEHWKCPGCGYDLFGLSGDPITCPECSAVSSRACLAARHADLLCELPDRRSLLLGISLGVGVILVAAVQLRPELWETYQVGVLVILAVTAFLLGLAEPRGAWRWGASVMIPALLAFLSAVITGPSDGLWIVGLCFLLGAALTLTICSHFGGSARWLQLRQDRLEAARRANRIKDQNSGTP